jgi:predicted porin
MDAMMVPLLVAIMFVGHLAGSAVGQLTCGQDFTSLCDVVIGTNVVASAGNDATVYLPANSMFYFSFEV